MEETRFDELTRALGAARSRRQTVRSLIAGAAGMVGLSRVRSAGADGGNGPVSGGGACAELGAACANNAGCCDSYCVGGVCSECESDLNCPGADTCEAGVCTPAACANDDFCGPNQVCCDGFCQMGDCCGDLDCPGAELCVDSGSGLPSCTPVLCAEESDCIGDQLCCGGVCQVGACCTVDSDCGDGTLCCDGACISCPDGGVCGAQTCGCGAGEIECDGTCAQCCGDSDCDISEACVDGVCAATCDADDDCTGNKSCIDEVCLCDGALIDCDGSCQMCCTFLDCPGTEICENGECVPLCLEAGEACDIDADCCSGSCDGGVCDGLLVTQLPETGAGPGR